MQVTSAMIQSNLYQADTLGECSSVCSIQGARSTQYRFLYRLLGIAMVMKLDLSSLSLNLALYFSRVVDSILPSWAGVKIVSLHLGFIVIRGLEFTRGRTVWISIQVPVQYRFLTIEMTAI